jgi:hypothetical protein
VNKQINAFWDLHKQLMHACMHVNPVSMHFSKNDDFCLFISYIIVYYLFITLYNICLSFVYSVYACVYVCTHLCIHTPYHTYMQLNVYVKESDYETLSKHKPAELKTATSYMSDIIRKKAEFLRSTEASDGTPIIPQYERQ